MSTLAGQAGARGCGEAAGKVVALLVVVFTAGCGGDSNAARLARDSGTAGGPARAPDAGNGPQPMFDNPDLDAEAAGANASGAGQASEADTALVYNAEAVLNGSCATSMVETELLPANVLFVLDRSGSMVCNPPPTTDSSACEEAPARADDAQPSKWEITTRALVDAVTALPSDTKVGLAYFSNDDRCGVSSTPSVRLAPNTPTQQATIANSLMSARSGGGTPLVGATILAYRHMHEAALAGRIAGNRFVVLITDGAQSEMCSNPPRCEGADACTELLVAHEVPRAAGVGVRIRTFAIGVPGSEAARSALSQIAIGGGTALEGCDLAEGNCHFDMTSVPDLATSLADALVQIADRAITCEIDVPQPASGEQDLDLLNVVYSPADGSPPELVFKDTRAPCDAGADGWQLAEGNTRIRLCGRSCERIRADVGARVDVVIGCPAQGPD
jgi:hypothetical protein